MKHLDSFATLDRRELRRLLRLLCTITTIKIVIVLIAVGVAIVIMIYLLVLERLLGLGISVLSATIAIKIDSLHGVRIVIEWGIHTAIVSIYFSRIFVH